MRALTEPILTADLLPGFTRTVALHRSWDHLEMVTERWLRPATPEQPGLALRLAIYRLESPAEALALARRSFGLQEPQVGSPIGDASWTPSPVCGSAALVVLFRNQLVLLALHSAHPVDRLVTESLAARVVQRLSAEG